MSILIIGCENTTDLELQLELAVLEYNEKLKLVKINKKTVSTFTNEYKTLKECLNKEADLSTDHFVYDERDIQIKTATACYEAGIKRLDKILAEQEKK